jgi:hypothetical protein
VALAALGVGPAAAAAGDGIVPILKSGTAPDGHQMKHLANDHHAPDNPQQPAGQQPARPR